jgi:NAD(P)-dependent dehydrogenase (short-subunit alcohol dehydrogenase family)
MITQQIANDIRHPGWERLVGDGTNGGRAGGLCLGRVALVTGASRGIGKALAMRLAAEGAGIAVVARSLEAAKNRSSLGETAAAVSERGGKVIALEADLASPGFDASALVDRVEDEIGPVDILVNNAAKGGYRSFADWSPQALRDAQQVNVWAPWELCRRCVPGMRNRGSGWILNVSSVAAVLPSVETAGLVGPAGSLYGGTKAMLNRFTVSLAAELRGSGVRANTLAPQAAAATESVVAAIASGHIREEDTEPLETMVEASVALVTGELSGRVTYSLELLDELRQPVHDLRGDALVAGWQPSDLVEYFDVERFSRR